MYRVKKTIRVVRRKWGLHQLMREEDHIVHMLGRAILDAVGESPSRCERDWIDRIEALRAKLAACSDPITRLDFGAGNSQATRTPMQMEAGVEVTNTVGEVCKKASKSRVWCLLLFNVIRKLKPKVCLEMGTAFGISAAYQAAALHINGSGRLVTLEGADSLAEVAKKNLFGLGLHDVEVVVGKFQDTLTPVLSRQQKVDYVFVDGHHDEEATLKYLDRIYEFLDRPSVVVFDDIAWSEGMKRAWRAIRSDPRISTAIDLGPVGLCAILDSHVKRKCYHIPLD